MPRLSLLALCLSVTSYAAFAPAVPAQETVPAATDATDRAAARPVAEEEVAYIADLCAGLPIGKVVAVSREIDDAGQLREAFRTIDKPTSCAEGGAWQIVEAET